MAFHLHLGILLESQLEIETTILFLILLIIIRVPYYECRWSSSSLPQPVPFSLFAVRSTEPVANSMYV